MGDGFLCFLQMLSPCSFSLRSSPRVVSRHAIDALDMSCGGGFFCPRRYVPLSLSPSHRIFPSFPSRQNTKAKHQSTRTEAASRVFIREQE